MQETYTQGEQPSTTAPVATEPVVPAGLKYAPGTRYSNSEIYDEASREVVCGWQVFFQRRPDGSSTGRLSFVANNGNLCGIEIAQAKREAARLEQGPASLDLLRELVRLADAGGDATQRDQLMQSARAVLLLADGLPDHSVHG